MFHNDYGHDAKKYFSLRDQIKVLVQSGIFSHLAKKSGLSFDNLIILRVKTINAIFAFLLQKIKEKGGVSN